MDCWRSCEGHSQIKVMLLPLVAVQLKTPQRRSSKEHLNKRRFNKWRSNRWPAAVVHYGRSFRKALKFVALIEGAPTNDTSTGVAPINCGAPFSGDPISDWPLNERRGASKSGVSSKRRCKKQSFNISGAPINGAPRVSLWGSPLHIAAIITRTIH